MLTFDVGRHICQCCLNTNYPTVSSDRVGARIQHVCTFCIINCRPEHGICSLPDNLRDFATTLRHAKFQASIAGIPIVEDPTMPLTEIELRGTNGRVRMINVGVPK